MFKAIDSGAYLTIEENPDCSVPVAVWRISESDECSLDEYEGCPDFYYKKVMRLPVCEIETGMVREYEAFVYIMHEGAQKAIPSEKYMQLCLEGYSYFGFDEQLIIEAYNKSVMDATSD